MGSRMNDRRGAAFLRQEGRNQTGVLWSRSVTRKATKEIQTLRNGASVASLAPLIGPTDLRTPDATDSGVEKLCGAI